MNQVEDEKVPQWSNTTKLIVALSIVAMIAFLLWKFQFILGPLLFAIVLAYLLYPVSGFFHKKLHFPWRLAATLLYHHFSGFDRSAHLGWFLSGGSAAKPDRIFTENNC